jgi:hypothetical protein
LRLASLARCLTTLPTGSRAGEPHGHRAHDHRSHPLRLEHYRYMAPGSRRPADPDELAARH